MKNNKKAFGFTLIELLVVVAIIAVLAALVFGYLGAAKNKGNDAGIEENLRNANAQAEIFWNTNTQNPDSYANVCDNVAQVGGANTLSLFMIAASKDAGLGGSYISDGSGGTGAVVACNVSASGDAWAAEAPLFGSTTTTPNMWCVDNSGKSKRESTSILTNTACN